MTKDEERKALKKIEKIIAEAGADSYIGYAFAGCVEAAETNIENDWACGPLQRAELLSQDLADTRRELKEAREQLAQAAADLRRAEADTMTPAQVHKIRVALSWTRAEATAAMNQATADMVSHCADPAGADFADAVSRCQAAKNRLALLDQIDESF